MSSENTAESSGTAWEAGEAATSGNQDSGHKYYRTIITQRAEGQIGEYLEYLVLKKKNIQAANAVSVDYDETVDRLAYLAGSLRVCDDEDLQKRGIRKIFMQSHDYVFLYRMGGDNQEIAYIEAIYHTLQDYENIFKRDVLDEIGDIHD